MFVVQREKKVNPFDLSPGQVFVSNGKTYIRAKGDADDGKVPVFDQLRNELCHHAAVADISFFSNATLVLEYTV